jgi:hypothetical protein
MYASILDTPKASFTFSIIGISNDIIDAQRTMSTSSQLSLAQVLDYQGMIDNGALARPSTHSALRNDKGVLKAANLTEIGRVA